MKKSGIPNQPLLGGRKEDALIAYTFKRYLETGDSTWPILFPMVKSAVRAMDVVQAVAMKRGLARVDRFVITGMSKRGWTTWLTGAVDARVAGIAPMVIDMLNMKAQTQWAARVYGGQSYKIRDYTQAELVKRMDEPPLVALREWVDPYSYRDRYNDLPKLILLGTNDPYWTVDSTRHYWSELPGAKWLFQTPNAGHDLDGRKLATKTLAAFFDQIAEHQSLPIVEWQFGSAGELSLTVNQAPEGIRLWTASSLDRDFRDDHWSAQSLPVTHEGRWHALARVAQPRRGFRAFFAEVTLKSPDGHEYQLSTEARVTPDQHVDEIRTSRAASPDSGVASK